MNRTEFIHISDIHYQNQSSPMATRLTSKTGVSFIEQFGQGMAYILNQYKEIDFFLISGDLVHESNAEEYRKLKKMWADICNLPVYTVPGNHDRDTYGYGFLETTDDPPYDREYIHAKTGLRILALDSRGGKYETGFLSSGQLNWLNEKLSRDLDTIILLHHTPHISGENEYLAQQMENPRDFYEIVKGSCVIAVFSGHTHKSFFSTLGDIPCYTVNSITHEINSGMDSMTLSNKTGFNHCLYENGRLTVRHICIPQDNPVEITIDYAEFEEAEIC